MLAYLSMARNGYESDRNNIVIHNFVEGQSANFRDDELTKELSFQSIVWAPSTSLSSSSSCLYAEAQFRGSTRIFQLQVCAGATSVFSDCLVMSGDASRSSVICVQPNDASGTH